MNMYKNLGILACVCMATMSKAETTITTVGCAESDHAVTLAQNFAKPDHGVSYMNALEQAIGLGECLAGLSFTLAPDVDLTQTSFWQKTPYGLIAVLQVTTSTGIVHVLVPEWSAEQKQKFLQDALSFSA